MCRQICKMYYNIAKPWNIYANSISYKHVATIKNMSLWMPFLYMNWCAISLMSISGLLEHEPLTGPVIDANGWQLEYFCQKEPAFRALQKLDQTWLKSLKFRYQYKIYESTYQIQRTWNIFQKHRTF